MLRQCIACFILVLVLPGFLVAQENETLDAQIQGKWKVVQAMRQEVKLEKFTGDVITFKDGKVTIEPKLGARQNGIYDLDDSQQPTNLDLNLVGVDQTEELTKGIVQIDGTNLKWCLARPGQKIKRPTKLDSKQQGTLLLTLERVK